jgi:hypothetical protein
MLALTCLTAAGLAMGFYCNGYALAAASLAMAIAISGSIAYHGFDFANANLMIGVALLQTSYLLGVAVSASLGEPRSAPSATM